MDTEHTSKQNKSSGILIGIIVILLIVSLAEGYYIYKKRTSAQTMITNNSMTPNNTTIKPASKQKPTFVMKGMKFSDSPLVSKAYLIYPVNGDLSTDAQKALTGWNVKTNPQNDGSTIVTLVPHEAEDIQQQFTVKTGYKLYFIEMTLVDDKSGIDENRGDDIGVLVDQNGIVE